MLKNIMRKRMLIMILWGFPLCFCGGAEFPEYSFAPSGNERFAVECYGSELVGSAQRPIPDEPGLLEKMFHSVTGWWVNESSEDWDRMLHDPEWPSYVDPEYWNYFLGHYPDYYDEVYNYFDGNIPYPPEPEPEDPIITPEDPSMPLSDDIGAIMGMILMGIAYGVFAYRMRRQ